MPIVYADHAATTPVRPAALAAFTEASSQVGNSSSIHASGRHARKVLEESRESIASMLAANATDVVFCSGGTEADNLAVKGLFAHAVSQDDRRNIVVMSAMEHPAVVESARWLADDAGGEVVLAPVFATGVVDLDWLSEFVDENSGRIALVALMWVNNETGVIQPVEAVLQMCRPHDIPVHCDAVQGVPWLPVPQAWRAHKLTLAVSGHKLGAPAGIGVLVKHNTAPLAQSHGGGQELKHRSGTVAVALAASLASALQEVGVGENARVEVIRDDLERALAATVDRNIVNGSAAARVPGIASITFDGCSAEAMLMRLDALGIECSAGSACAAGISRPSQTLLAMGMTEAAAVSTLRFSFGWNSTAAGLVRLQQSVPEIVGAVRAAGRSTVRSSS